MSVSARQWIGKAVPRKEDDGLLSGAARFIDDLSPVAGMRFAAILRSPHPHARIARIDTARALDLRGVVGVFTGSELMPLMGPIPSVVRAPVPAYPIAIDRVRYVGEPVAVVVAESRYIAEDACDLIEVEYEVLPAAADLASAMAEGAPLLHDEAGSNVINRRSFRYGDPDRAFADADRTFEFSYTYPRYASTPMETFGVIAHFERAPDRFTVWSNFQGPFVLQPLMAGALRVPVQRLRLITPPHSGGSFGIKQALAPYIVLFAAVSRLCGAAVKWIEDRAEHLTAASASSDRIGTVAAAFSRDGEMTALRFHNVANMGAYVRAPEPASLYRMHAASNGCYRVRHIAVENEIVVTNRTPVGLNRGYGGPQFYFALERIMEIAARGLGIDPAELRRRNFVPADAFPYHAPAGAVFDSGDYEAALAELLRIADYEDLKKRRDEARRDGRLYGIGLAAGVEPSGSNMAYVSLAQTLQERSRSDRKSGGNASATISVDPGGQVTVRLCSTPNGQGHATVAAQIVADALGLQPSDIDVVTDIDTLTSAWSIASGNYSNRFASIVVDAIARSSEQTATKIRRLAAEALEAAPEDIELSGGYARVRDSNKGMPFRKVCARAHWDPAHLPPGMTPGIHETAVVSPPVLGAIDEQDRIGSATTFGFVIDLAAVEIDRRTGAIRIDKYASVHDVGTQLNPSIVDGQIHGGFVHGLGAALLEELIYDERGNFQSATFADYLCPTAPEVPPVAVGHVETSSPTNAMGSKGMGDGSSMLTPAALANAVADALGRDDIVLPLTLQRVWALANPEAAQAPARRAAQETSQPAKGRGALTGEGEVVISASPAEVWRCLVDPRELAGLVPGCEELRQTAPDRYAARVTVGVAGIRGVYDARVELHDREENRSVRLVGSASGALGFGSGTGFVTLTPEDDARRTRLAYRYEADVGGKVAAVGQRMLGTVTRVLIGQFFRALERRFASAGRAGAAGWRSWLPWRRP